MEVDISEKYYVYTCNSELTAAIKVGVEDNDRSSFSIKLDLTQILKLVVEDPLVAIYHTSGTFIKDLVQCFMI